MKKTLLSLPIVADILGVSKSTVNSWVKNKKISNVKKDKRGKVLIDKQELLKFEQAKFMFEISFLILSSNLFNFFFFRKLLFKSFSLLLAKSTTADNTFSFSALENRLF